VAELARKEVVLLLGFYCAGYGEGEREREREFFSVKE